MTLFKNTHILQTKRGSITDEGTFTAYVSTFGGSPDLQGDVIERSAFAKSIADNLKNNNMPAMLWNHDSALPIGKWTSFIEDSFGLLATGKLTLATKLGAEAHALMKDDALQFSIGFAGAVSYMRGSIRHITNIERLAEVSLTALPANQNTKLVAMKNASMNKRNIERHLRESGGLSRSQAKSVAAGNWGNLFRDENGVDKVNRMISAIETLTIAINESGN